MADIFEFPDPEISQPEETWGADLRRTKSGLVPGSYENAGIFLENHTSICSRLEYNAFTVRAMVTRPFPWGGKDPAKHPREIAESDAVNFCRWLERQGQYGVSREKAFNVMGSVAEANPRHPLQEWLNSLRWDSKERIKTWLNYYMGTDDNEYTRAVGFRFLIGAVARALNPGCKMDTMLIFEGDQGMGKSTAARTLFGTANFTDSLSQIGTKDAAQELGGKWCIEIAELAQFVKSDHRHIKEVLSKSSDRFRPAYGRVTQDFPRHCVFIGTYNPSANGPLKDETGARRFWPVKTRSVDLDALEADREQIWAEAVHQYRLGTKWWLQGDETELAEAEQEDRYDEDVWQDEVAKLTETLRETTIPVILADMGIKTERQDKSNQMRIATCLRRLGFEKYTKWVGGKAMKIWVKPE